MKKYFVKAFFTVFKDNGRTYIHTDKSFGFNSEQEAIKYAESMDKTKELVVGHGEYNYALLIKYEIECVETIKTIIKTVNYGEKTSN